MTELKPYSEYKDSGVEWIGKVPREWKKVKYKRIFQVRNGHGFPDQLQGNRTGQYPFLKVSDISFEGKYVTKAANYVSESTIENKRWGKIDKGSILTAKIGEALRKNHRKINCVSCVIDNNMMALTPILNYDLNYMYYILNTVDFDWYSNPGAVPSLNNSYFREDYVVTPSNKEQKKIARFLNKKISEIETLIFDKERLIELLEEKRQAVITETVTKGLDPNVKMKDSGIEWIGEIPEHWEIKKINYIVDMKNRKAPNDSNLPYLGLENVSSKTGNIINFNTESAIEGGSLLFSKNDVLFGKLRPYLMKCVIAPISGRCTSEFLVLRSKKGISNSRFLQYTMLSNYFIERVNSATYGAKMPRANWDFIRNLYTPLPSYQEQKSIGNSIEEKLEEIDELINKINNQISNLKEYRESLIYEAVTGKIDVRDYARNKEEVY